MSLVYNNDKLIGKCSKYAIEKVQGTSPFVMLENFEPKQPQLNENQQIVLDWLKEEKTNSSLTAFDCIYSFIYGNPKDLVIQIWSELNEKEECQVLEAFGKWAQEQEED